MDNFNLNDSFTVTATPGASSELTGIISDYVRDTIMFINFVILCGPISLLGIIFNAINIVVFIKLGFQESVNISLLFLCVSDTGSLIFLIWGSVLYNPFFMEEYPTWDINDVMYLTAGWPHVTFTRVGSWITVYITLERYLCIAIPLKVKRIITPKKTVIVNILIFFSIIGSILPSFVVSRIAPKFDPETNSTVIGHVYIENGQTVESGAILFSAINQIVVFIFVIIFTGGLVHKFRIKSKWRNDISSSGNNDSISSRDRKLVKMIIFIASIFLITNISMIMTQITIVTYNEFSISGRYKNLFVAITPFSFTLQALNSSVNIFVYINLSSKFREILMSLVGRHRPTKTKTQS